VGIPGGSVHAGHDAACQSSDHLIDLESVLAGDPAVVWDHPALGSADPQENLRSHPDPAIPRWRNLAGCGVTNLCRPRLIAARRQCVALHRLSWDAHDANGLRLLPVVSVTTYDAAESCSRLGRRPPNAAERQWIARETDGALFPVGIDRPNRSRVNAILGEGQPQGRIVICSAAFARGEKKDRGELLPAMLQGGQQLGLAPPLANIPDCSETGTGVSRGRIWPSWVTSAIGTSRLNIPRHPEDPTTANAKSASAVSRQRSEQSR
jgi:hypothetical protein